MDDLDYRLVKWKTRFDQTYSPGAKPGMTAGLPLAVGGSNLLLGCISMERWRSPRASGEILRGLHTPWHLLYFLPLPQGHFSFRPIFRPSRRCIARFSSQLKQVHAGGCAVYQLVLTIPHLCRAARGYSRTWASANHRGQYEPFIGGSPA